jgi:hypothetical protein
MGPTALSGLIRTLVNRGHHRLSVAINVPVNSYGYGTDTEGSFLRILEETRVFMDAPQGFEPRYADPESADII